MGKYVKFVTIWLAGMVSVAVLGTYVGYLVGSSVVGMVLSGIGGFYIGGYIGDRLLGPV